jgi:hypothetical protein
MCAQRIGNVSRVGNVSPVLLGNCQCVQVVQMWLLSSTVKGAKVRAAGCILFELFGRAGDVG